MALDAGLAAIVGAGVAGLLGLGQTYLVTRNDRLQRDADRAERQRERDEDVRLNAHQREIDKRRELYVEAVAAVDRAQTALLGYQYGRDLERQAEKEDWPNFGYPDVTDDIEEARAALAGLLPRLAPAIPTAVLRPFGDITSQVAAASRALSARQGYDADLQATGRALNQMLYAIRSDLGVSSGIGSAWDSPAPGVATPPAP
jgi:hypothetical protein